jgi:REP element-mobilizing transposase RayT
MPRLARLESPKQISHVINRGVEKRIIFLGAEDYSFFLTQAREVFRTFRISLLSYCLMPNHFHLLTAMTDGGLSGAMQTLQTRYSMYFNRVYRRVGHLFQDRFKSFAVEDTDYLAWLPVYINMNPVRAGLAGSPGAWEWSSHGELLSGASRYLDLPRLGEFGIAPTAFQAGYGSWVDRWSRPLPPEASLLQILQWAAFAAGVRWQDVRDGAKGGPFTHAKLLLIEHARDRGYVLQDIAAILGCSPAALRGLLADAAQEKGQTL